MTKQKKLKRLVRERMQKTGERYAAARRHVVARVADEEGSAAGKGPGPRHVPGSVPATAALGVVLEAAGVRDAATGRPFSEALLYGIAGGIGAGVFAFHYAKEGVSTFFVAGRHLWHDDLEYLGAAARRFGIEPVVRESGGAAKARAQLDELLAGGRPVVAWVDHGSLPHRASPAQWSGGGYHVVAVYGASAEEVVFGDLCDVPVRLERGRFEAARARIAKQKNRLLALPAEGGALELEPLLRDGLAACVRSLRSGRMKSFRLDALEEWAKRLHGSRGKDAWESVFARGAKLWQGLSSLHDFVEHYGTGGGLGRALFADCFAAAAERPGGARWSELAERYGALGRGWSELADAALPGEVPLFAEAKRLLERKAEILASGGEEATEEVRATWAELDRLAGEAARDFPLDEAGCDALRAELQERVAALAAGEREALDALAGALDG